MKKILSLVLALTVCAGALAGCWGRDSSSGSSSSSSSSSGSSSAGSGSSGGSSGSGSSSSMGMGDPSSSGSSLGGSSSDVTGSGSSSSSAAQGGSSAGSDPLGGASGGSSSGVSRMGQPPMDSLSPQPGEPGRDPFSTPPDPNTGVQPASLDMGADWQLMVVNAQNPLPEDFTVQTVPVRHYDDRLFDARAVDHLNDLMEGAADAGLPLYLVSTYRSVGRQKALFQRKINFYLEKGYDEETARAEAAKWVAAPGTSEHNLGLAADLVSADWYQSHDDLTEEFETTPEFAWLEEHCAEYGFILRYPKGKPAVTGIAYEPWHFRYVGVDAAQLLTAQGLCLEEI